MQDYTDFLGQVLHTGTNAPVGAVTPSTTPFSVEGPPKPSGNDFGGMVKSFLEGLTNPQILLPGHSASEASGGFISGAASAISFATDLPRMATVFVGAVLIVAALIGLTRSSGV
jgi:hypothetical protein